MLLTKTSPINQYLNRAIQSTPIGCVSIVNNLELLRNTLLLLEDAFMDDRMKLIVALSHDIEELVEDFFPALQMHHYEEAIHYIQCFRMEWIESHLLEKSDTQEYALVEGLIADTLATMTILTLATQLVFTSYFTLPVTIGLSLLMMSISIKITTPTYVSLGTLRYGTFNYRVIRKRAQYNCPFALRAR